MQLGGYRSYYIWPLSMGQLSCLSSTEAAFDFDERREKRERNRENKNDKERENGSEGRKHVAKNYIFIKRSFASILFQILFSVVLF